MYKIFNNIRIKGKKIEYLLNNYQNLIKNINKIVPETCIRTEEQLQFITKEIIKKKK